MIRSSGWYRYAWDPVEGCKNKCWYCYAAKRISDFENVKFFEERLDEPEKVKPTRIFVNHLSDIMGDWIPKLWIRLVIGVCQLNPLHTFIWMTKNPARYKDFEFSSNCILGVTIESLEYWDRAKTMEGLNNRKMCSIEPILGSFKGYDFSQFEFVVIGELDGKGNYKNYRTVKHKKIYYKL